MSGEGVERDGLPRRVCSVAIGWVLAGAIAVIVPACFHPVYDRPTCGAHGECPSGSSCSAQNICESKVEVVDGGSTSIDASSPGDARACFGTGLVSVCLAAAPTMPLTISGSTTINTVDTSTSSKCVATVSGGEKYCVVAATDITINATLRATGAKPLVLIASNSITVTQVIDVGSHRTTPEFIGAGADPMAACMAAGGTAAGVRAGGAGGSFNGKGGQGGDGGGGGAGSGGQAGNAITPTELRGGCPGQDGDGAGNGTGGHGGGAVFLIAGNRIDITGPGINAAGEGGAPGTTGSSGAGGGGAGGMIGFEASMISCSSLILANGGAGGEGSGTLTPGGPGSDPVGTAAAPGGTGGTANGGDGGNGSSGAAGGAGANGKNGNSQVNNEGGGGGGGGGAGFIKGPPSSLGNSVSPDATP
jgi:hypothetical protein